MFGISGKVIAGAAGKRNFDLDALIHLARLTAPSRRLEDALNALIIGLKADDIWAKLDMLCVQHDSQVDSLLDLRGNQDSTTISSPTWSAAGWAISTAGYLDTQIAYNAASYANVGDNHLMVYTSSHADTVAHLMAVGSNISQTLALGKSSSSAVFMNMAINQATYIGDGYFSGNAPEITIQ